MTEPRAAVPLAQPDGGAGVRNDPGARPRWPVWLLAARPRTLLAAVAPVVLGTALALGDGVAHPVAAALALFGAIMIQVATNFNNDLQDFVSGADTAERQGPMRVTQAGLVQPAEMRVATVVAFALATLAGLYLVWRGGAAILVVGLLSILFGYLYSGSRYSLARLGLGDVFVLIFFGPVAVGGTYFVQALTLPTHVIVAGLGPGLLATAILLVNNVRDVNDDRRAGKRTLVVRFGRSFGVALYAACVALAAALPIALFAAGYGTPWVMLASLIALPGAGAVRELARRSEGPLLNRLLGRTAMLLLVYSVLFAVGWNL